MSSRPPFVPRDKPRYHVHDDGQPIIEAQERCHNCGGEGVIETEVTGGRWNSFAQGGMWEPAYNSVECPQCNGFGTVTFERCAACGEHWDDCKCDSDAYEVFRTRVNVLAGVWERMRGVALAAHVYGFRPRCAIEGVSWNLLHVFSARENAPALYPPRTSGRAVVNLPADADFAAVQLIADQGKKA